MSSKIVRKEKKMSNRSVCRFVWVAMLVVFGCLNSTSFASDETKSLALSNAMAQVKLFVALTEGERETLKSTATLRRGLAGEHIIEQGKRSGRMFIVLDGQAQVCVNGRRIVSLSGQFLVGEIEFLDELPATADVLLIQDTDLIELDNVALTNLMEKKPRLGFVLMREIAKIEAKRLRKTTED
jgi:CRP/FNR family transcriptional regulator, cyclic AMP receptor protein